MNVTNELKRQPCTDSPRLMESEMENQTSVLRNFSVVSCLCISRVTNVLAETATIWAQRICAYVQSEFQEFSDIQEDSAGVEQHPDPAFIAYIKGEILDPDAHSQQTGPGKVESRYLKKTTREKNNKKARKVKKHTSTCQQRSEVGRQPDLRMKPPPVEELVFRRKGSFVSTGKVSPGSREPHRRECSGERTFSGHYHQSQDCYDYSQDTVTHDSVNSQAGAEKSTNHLRFPGILLVVAVVTALVRGVEKVFAHVQREWTEFNDICGHHSADVQYTEPAFIAYLKGDGAAPFVSCPHVKFNM